MQLPQHCTCKSKHHYFRTQLCRPHMNESSFRHGRPWQVASAGLNVKPRRAAHLSSGVMTSSCSVNRAMTFLMVMFLQNKYKKDGKFLELICICVPQLHPCLWLISCCSGGHQTVYRCQRNQAESCKWNSAMEIRAASIIAKFLQSNRTDKWIELTMQLFHSCLTARVGTWSTIRFMTQYTKKNILHIREIHCSGSLYYNRIREADSDTVVINWVGSHLYRTMDSFHKSHMLV